MLLLTSCKVMMSNYYVKAKVSIIWSWNWGFHCVSEKKRRPGYCLHLSPPAQIISNGTWVMHGCVPIQGLILQSEEVYAKPETCRASWGFAFVTLYARSDLQLHSGAFPIVLQIYILLVLSSCYSSLLNTIGCEIKNRDLKELSELSQPSRTTVQTEIIIDPQLHKLPSPADLQGPQEKQRDP